MENDKDQYYDSIACSVISEKQYFNFKIILFSSMQIYFASDNHYMQHSLTKLALSRIFACFPSLSLQSNNEWEHTKNYKKIPHYKHVNML